MRDPPDTAWPNACRLRPHSHSSGVPGMPTTRIEPADRTIRVNGINLHYLAFPNGTLVEIPGAGHNVPTDDRVAFRTVVREWMGLGS